MGFGFVVCLTGLACSGVLACASTPPPPSRFPSAEEAIARMRATYACSRGVVGDAKVNYFGEKGRIRGSMLFVTSRPERLRFDVVSPFGVTVSTLTSDGKDFSLLDFTSKQFVHGPATECNVARFLHVPVPPFALVALLAGEAPVLVHDPSAASLTWDSGAYLISIKSSRGASEEIRLEPRPEDWEKPWSEQRVRVRDVRVVQQGIELYEAQLESFRAASTAGPRADPDGIDPDVPPSGPACGAEVPRHVRITSDASAQDVVIVHSEISHNPPITNGLFRQLPPAGVKIHVAACR
jgi:outer membrane lipoprotein-sorting protein